MTVLRTLHALDGIARTQDLLARGHTYYEFKKYERDLVRPRRGWIALATADPMLIFAAQHGGVLTCITQAHRLGLWVLKNETPHLAMRNRNRHRPNVNATFHWRRPMAPRSPAGLTDSIENALVLVATCRPFEEALTIFESALRKDMVTDSRLRALPLPRQAKVVLDACSPFSDSGLETIFRSRFRWLPVPLRQQVTILGHRVDFLIGERLVVQLDGGHHVGEQRDADIRHDALLNQHGYTVIRLSYAQIMYRWHEVHDLIIGAMMNRVHVAS